MMNTTDLFNVCPDPECPAKTGALQDPAWRFGAVWLDGRQTCSCGAPLFPLAACSKCSTVSLSADLVIDPETLEQRLVRPRSEKANAEAWRNFELLGTADLLEQSAAADEEAAEALEADKAELKREAEAERQRAAKREAEDVPEDFDRSASSRRRPCGRCCFCAGRRGRSRTFFLLRKRAGPHHERAGRNAKLRASLAAGRRMGRTKHPLQNFG